MSSHEQHRKMIQTAAENYTAIASKLAEIQQDLQSARRVTLMAIGTDDGPAEVRIARGTAEFLASEQDGPIGALINQIGMVVTTLIELEGKI